MENEKEISENYHEVIHGDSTIGKYHCWGVYDIRYPNGLIAKDVFRVYDLVSGSAVLVLDDDGYFYFNRQYRDTASDYLLETPRGGRQPEDINFAACARREALEETGMEPTALVDLGTVRPDTGLISNEVHLYLAKVRPFIPKPQVEEGILAIEKYTLAEVQQLIRENKITDGYTLAALLRYLLLGA